MTRQQQAPTPQRERIDALAVQRLSRDVYARKTKNSDTKDETTTSPKNKNDQCVCEFFD